MGLLLDFGYLAGAIVTSPWLLYRLVLRGDWQGLSGRFGRGIGPSLDGSIWFHGASAGEISLLKPIVERLEREMPVVPIVISAYSSTGYAAARQAFQKHRVILFPVDLTFVVGRYLERFNPRLIVVVESDFWPNFLASAQRSEIPVAVINGKMSQRSYRRYSRLGFLAGFLKRIDAYGVQTPEQAERVTGLGIDPNRVLVTGNMKYDLTRPDGEEEADELRASLGYSDSEIVVIGGSVHEREDEALLDAFLGLEPGPVALMLVPRYPRDANRVADCVKARGWEAVLKTAVDRGESAAPGVSGVLVVDTVGELRRLYAAADIAFVGGSLYFRGANKGGHNLMEPAILARPVVFGPHHSSFRDTVEALLSADAAIEVSDGEELAAALSTLAQDAGRRRNLGARARDVVLSRQGATERNYELIHSLVLEERESLPVQPIESTMPPAVGDTDST